MLKVLIRILDWIGRIEVVGHILDWIFGESGKANTRANRQEAAQRLVAQLKYALRTGNANTVEQVERWVMLGRLSEYDGDYHNANENYRTAYNTAVWMIDNNVPRTREEHAALNNIIHHLSSKI